MRLGADPEVFIVDRTGKHLSAIGRIGGDKYNPLQVKGMRKGFTLQEDNVALEFGIPPASNADEFVNHIKRVMLAGLFKVNNGQKDLKFSTLSCVVFDGDQMEHPGAHVFGCEPDFNAWTEEENKKPKPPQQFMRSAGGHVHVETKINPIVGVRNMDLYVGVPSTLMDTGVQRRLMYGKAGAHRVKSYGFEYRTPSNFWVFHEKYIRWMWRATERAMKSDLKIENLRGPIEDAINNDNRKVAEELVKEFQLEVV